MSGITGVYHLDTRSVSDRLVAQMTEVIAHRGPDRQGLWVSGPVGLGHRMLFTTPESVEESQPLVDQEADLCIVLDGRVDNRPELEKALRAGGARSRSNGDAELILRSYELWGQRCLEHILGDFAFAIWDGKSRSLFCARDPFGMRPFFYYRGSSGFLCGSELRQLLEDPEVPCEPNEGMIGEYLASTIRSKNETLYRGIHRLPPGHFLRVDPGSFRISPYWSIDPGREVRYRRDDEYAEHLLEILDQAVCCRLRSQGPVGAELSGGLDSSAVVGMVQRLYGEGMARDDGFEVFSLVFPGLDCDESSFIDAVVQKWDLRSDRVAISVPDTECYARQVALHRDLPSPPNDAMADPLRARVQERGFRVLLTGLGGDHCLGGSVYQYADFLRSGRLLSLLRQLIHGSRIPGAGGVLSILYRYGALPLVPDWIRQAVRGLRGRGGPSPAPPWIDPGFSHRIKLQERLGRLDARPRFRSLSQQDHYNAIQDPFGLHCLELAERAQSRFGSEWRHPLFDRRLVEFALAIPEEQRWRGDRTKFVLRQAVGKLLPERVRNRLTKTYFPEIFVRHLLDLGGRKCFETLQVASVGWVRGPVVLSMYDRMVEQYQRGDPEYGRLGYQLWMVFGVEMWFNHCVGGRSFVA